jgi:hypothetical protein
MEVEAGSFARWREWSGSEDLARYRFCREIQLRRTIQGKRIVERKTVGELREDCGTKILET